jgi:hypothetical protein
MSGPDARGMWRLLPFIYFVGAVVRPGALARAYFRNFRTPLSLARANVAMRYRSLRKKWQFL